MPSNSRHFQWLCSALALLLLVASASAQIYLEINPNSTTRSDPVNADYSSTHLFLDEINGDSIPVTVFFISGTTGVDEADVFTNLNNRDRASMIPSGATLPEGISAPNGNNILSTDTNDYYQAYPMSIVPGGGGYQVTLYAAKTGAYRLTARYHMAGDPATTWHWYGDFPDGSGYNYRDAAIVVSPTKARSMNMYELDVLNVDAEAPSIINSSGSQTVQTSTDLTRRSTFDDLYGGPHATTIRPWNLAYAQNLGVNWLWLQPVHPIGVAGRQLDPNNSNQPFAVGSPYSVKNFFAINPLMSKTYVPGTTPDATGRANALKEFQGFVAAADAAGINVMLDVPFNHTSFDCELDTLGQTLFGNAGTTSTSQFWNVEARVYSRWNGPADLTGANQTGTDSTTLSYFNYGERASGATSIALASDRYDFGKFVDVHDVYFGYYAALVYLDNSTNEGDYLSEGDWFDSSIGPGGVDAPNSSGSGNGHFDSVTQGVWQYFAWYVPYWLGQTGHTDSNGILVGNSTNPNPVARRTEDDRGLDGIRADFAQGLPPQLWEYIINVARSYKWDFVFLAESLDGGHVTYRSGRHFDVLNENVIFDYYNAQNTSQFRSIYDGRRSTYGQAMVLWDTESHDEAGYSDPYQALIRYACSNTIDGTPDIFFGQEIGISGAVTPPNSNTFGKPFGFSLYQVNFNKPIPQFMTPNSLAPAWDALGPNAYGQAFLYPVYSAIGHARAGSSALQNSNRYYLNDMSGNVPGSIFGVAKYVTANAAPNPGITGTDGPNDVVFAFVNLDRNDTQSDTFNVNITQNGSNLFGINPSRTYNVKNIAADTAYVPGRNNVFLWGSAGINGSTLLANGLYVSLNPVPSGTAGWTTAPYEAQYLRLYDVTAPTTPPATASGPYAYNYVLGGTGTTTFSWASVSPDSAGIVPSYNVTVTINGTTSQTATVTGSTSYTVSNLTPGENVTITVVSANPYNTAAVSPTSTSSAPLLVLDPNADQDGTGMSNAAKAAAGLNPFDPHSVFRINSITYSGGSATINWSSVSGKTYVVQSTTTLSGTWVDIAGSTKTGNGDTLTFTDTTAAGSSKFYRVRLGP